MYDSYVMIWYDWSGDSSITNVGWTRMPTIRASAYYHYAKIYKYKCSAGPSMPDSLVVCLFVGFCIETVCKFEISSNSISLKSNQIKHTTHTFLFYIRSFTIIYTSLCCYPMIVSVVNFTSMNYTLIHYTIHYTVVRLWLFSCCCCFRFLFFV